jgi:acyl-coenzyme A synthetase/AMP-(fatty) acid ligase
LCPSKPKDRFLGVRSLKDTECFIVDSDGKVCPPNVHGELVVRGPHIMSGYWRDAEATDRRFRLDPATTERLLYTGDICSMDEEGYLYFHGRGDEVYKYREVRFTTLEMEAAALPPSTLDGPILFVVSVIDKNEVVAGLEARLEFEKVAPYIIRIPEMPRTTNHKVDKGRLQKLIAALDSSKES